MTLYIKTARMNNINTLLMGIGSYLCNQRSKRTNLVDLQVLSNYPLFSKKKQKFVKKETLNLKVYYIIPLNNIQKISKSNYIIFKKN